MNRTTPITGNHFVVGTTIALAIFVGVLTGCSETFEGEKAEQLAALYAEVLIAQHLPEEDASTRIDSLLDINGFENEEELQNRIEELARDYPDGLRAMFDSTQKRLEQIRDGQNDTKVGTDSTDGRTNGN